MGASDQPSETPTPMVELAISGMTCSGCTSAVERVLARIPGVARVRVELVSGRAWIYGSAPSSQLLDTVQAAGYGARLVAPSDSTRPAAASMG